MGLFLKKDNEEIDFDLEIMILQEKIIDEKAKLIQLLADHKAKEVLVNDYEVLYHRLVEANKNITAFLITVNP